MSIIGTKGRPFVSLGGEHAWGQQRVVGDIVVTFQWLDVGKKEPHPCMVLFPATLKMDGGAYAIPQDNAYEYGDANGKPTPYLLTAAYNAAVSMGFFPDKSTAFRIVDIIVDALPDLIRMPSDQPAAFEVKEPVMGIEATVRAGGKVISEEVI